MDAIVTKAATAAIAAMAATEISFAVGAVGSHSGDRQCITAVAVVLVVGRHNASHDGILQHEWRPAMGGMQQCPAVIVAGGDRDGMIYAFQGGLQNLVLEATRRMSLALKGTT